jgi:hypothetical protein
MFEGGHYFLWQDSSTLSEIIRFLAERGTAPVEIREKGC